MKTFDGLVFSCMQAIVDGLFVAIISINVLKSFVTLVGFFIICVKPFSKSVDCFIFLSSHLSLPTE